MRRASLEQAEKDAHGLARWLHEHMPEGWGFLLWLGSRGAGGYSTYVSDFARDDAIRCVEEWYQRVRGSSLESIETRDECWCCGSREALVSMRGNLRSVSICVECYLQASRG